MRNTILGAVAGLFLGTVGALAYSHYLGDGSLLADLQAKLDESNADLAKLKNDHIRLARQTSGESTAAADLAVANANLREQLDAAKSGSPTAVAAPAPEINVATLAGMMMGMMRGGGGPFQSQQRLFTMQARLKLTPDQAAKIKAAMDADNQARRDMMRQRFGGGRGGGGPGGQGGQGGPGGGGNNGGGANGGAPPAATATANNLDKTLATVLTYQQQADYQKLQSDEKAARAETSATSQVNGVMPLLQLTDTQKDAAMQALYQVQMQSPDPQSLMMDPNPMAAITAQAQATQGVLAKVLSPDQMALYQQEAKAQADAMAQFQQGGRQRGNRGVNGGGAATTNTTSGAPPTASSAPAATPAAATADGSASTNAPTATAPTTNADGTPVAPVATTNADGTPVAPAATTNAAPTQ